MNVCPYLTTRSMIPENQEAPINFLPENSLPANYFYRRNHFYYPCLNCRSFFITLEGDVNRPLNLSYRSIVSMPSKSVTMVLECSGNKRANFEPKTFGEQWKEGAIFQGNWKGVPLRYLLKQAGIKPTAAEVVFEGWDIGSRPDTEEKVVYKRSLPVEKALNPEVIIAYELDNRPIPYKHGYPFRLVVPGWYGMASVKWLKSIKVISHKFEGPFQTKDYVYYPNKNDDVGKTPVTAIKVNSIIQKPLDYEILDNGEHLVKGVAYTGEGCITRVRISFDGGSNWEDAEVQLKPEEPRAWTPWSYKWKVNEKGEYTIMVKASDSAGRNQPDEAEWNRKGYGYNAVTMVHVKVE